mgnify:CR=1 FL=1
MIAKIDKEAGNADGKLTKDEFLKAEILPKEIGSWLFDYSDTDCSGHVTAKEVYTAMRNPGTPTSEEEWKEGKAAGKLPALPTCKK